MADENGMNEFSENTDRNTAESGIIISVLQVQSIDIPHRFNRVKTQNGWIINLLESGRIAINFITTMRKMETAMMAGDSIERDNNDLIIIRNQPVDTYRSQRSSTSLTRTRERLLSTESPIKTPETSE